MVDEEQAELTQHIGELFYCSIRVVSSLFRRTSGMQLRPLPREGGMLDRQIRRPQVGASVRRAHVTPARRVSTGAQGSPGVSSARRGIPASGQADHRTLQRLNLLSARQRASGRSAHKLRLCSMGHRERPVGWAHNSPSIALRGASRCSISCSPGMMRALFPPAPRSIYYRRRHV